MIHLLAAELPDPNSYAALGWIIAGVFGIVGLVNQGKELWDRFFPKASPPAHEVYATKEELEKSNASHRLSDARIERRFEEWMEQEASQHSESMTELKNCINAFREWQLTIENALGRVGTKADIALSSDKRKR